MAGRPRKVVGLSTGKIGKEAIKQREEQEKKNRLPREQLLKAPDWLSKVAKEEFNRVVQATAEINLLDNLDLSVLAIYCSSYATYIDTVAEIRKEGYIMAGGKMNPLVNVQEKSAKLIMQCSTKLGMATTDRLKLIVPTSEEKSVNKYLKYLNG